MQEIYIGNGKTEYHLHSLNQRIPSIVNRGLSGLDSPLMRIDSYDNPGIRGQTVSQALPGGSIINIAGSLRALHHDDSQVTLNAYYQERQRLEGALTHTYNSLGRAQPLTLRFTDALGRELQAEVFRSRFEAPLELPTSNRWQLQLINPRGIIEAQYPKVATVNLPKDGGVVFDLEWDIVFGDSSGGTTTATNSGTTEAEPVIRLYGPMANPIITNATSNEFIALNHTLLPGETVTIDARHNTIIQGQSTNRMGARRTGSILWSLQPGLNVINLAADTYNSGYAQIEWRDAYEGL